jgi:hypothetical protein
MNQHDSTAAAAAALASFGVLWAILIFGGLALSILINWRIATKAGFQGPMSLLMLIPLVNFVILLIFAFGEWPVEREVKALRQGGGGPPGAFGGAQSWQPPART